jgi:hypothetical protein
MQLAMASALLEKSGHSRNALADLAPVTPPTRNALADLMLVGMMVPRSSANGMLGSPSPLGLGLPPGASSLLGGLATKTRFTFYSFHYADVMRVNQIRKCDQFKTTDQQTPRVVDRSLWETAKKTNPAALASMIDKALLGTSATCVLAGTDTWSREWVKYEIARSLERGKGLLTVFIHNCPCPNNGRAAQGYNPLDQIALGLDMRIYEWEPYVGWKPHGRVTEKLTSWPKWLPQPAPGNLMRLSAGARSYDWVADDGAHNLIHWTDAAAAAAGK